MEATTDLKSGSAFDFLTQMRNNQSPLVCLSRSIRLKKIFIATTLAGHFSVPRSCTNKKSRSAEVNACAPRRAWAVSCAECSFWLETHLGAAGGAVRRERKLRENWIGKTPPSDRVQKSNRCTFIHLRCTCLSWVLL